MKTSTPCPRCKGGGETCVAGNRITRTCPSCKGRGYLDADEAMTDEVGLELVQLHALKREYERRIAEMQRVLGHVRRHAAEECACCVEHRMPSDTVRVVDAAIGQRIEDPDRGGGRP